MIKSFADIPAAIQSHIVPQLTEKDKVKSKEAFVYMLRMFWQSRYDKMNSDYKEHFDWISQHCLPPHVVYLGVQIQTNLISSDFDHTKLASDVYEFLYELKNPVVVKQKQGVFAKICSLFSGKQ